MENVADALKMAASVLIFIIAVASSFSLFGLAKQTADSIITMRDQQKYLEAATLDNGILYTSSSAISGIQSGNLTQTEKRQNSSNISGITRNGDRTVNISDIVFTIRRYVIEKYGVTIMKSNGEVLARFDSSTEAIMRRWNEKARNESGQLVPYVTDENKEKYIGNLKENLNNVYITSDIKLNLENLYKTNQPNVFAPWGNANEIQERINVDLVGGRFRKYSSTSGEQIYTGKNILSQLTGKRIVEVTNEIDQSQYVQDAGQTTNLLQQYEMPTVEIIYIIL